MATLVGQTVSHYKILERLGGGGMGVVYKALDLKLDRPVALKFLSPELIRDPQARTRFIHEAKAASALQHNNICTVHDVDETADGALFIVMDLYDGETLKEKIDRGPLQISEAVNVAVQIAQGLSEAHRAGIIHRDIKPANIHITKSGIAKILDFGLAKLGGRTLLTKEGSTIGTAAYMSPEQATGENLDERTDIWSFGVVLHEMLAGQRPFKAEYENALIYAILNVDPKPLSSLRADVPPGVERVVAKCLARNPEERYRHMDEIITDLRSRPAEAVETPPPRQQLPSAAPGQPRKRILRYGLAASGVLAVGLLGYVLFWPGRETEPPATRLKMIAVLPFENLGPTDDDYFADGLTEEITARLGAISGLGVISRQSAIQYKKSPKTLPVIARELGVDYVLAATIRWVKNSRGQRIRITAHLLQVTGDVQLWAENMERTLDDIFVVQTEIATRVVSALGIVLTEEERGSIRNIPTKNLDAYQAFLKGVSFLQDLYQETNTRIAIEMFERAVALDSTFALGYVGLARAHLSYYWAGFDRTAGRLAKSKQAIDRAFALQPDLPDALGVLCMYYYWGFNDYVRALETLTNASKKLPNDSRILEVTGYIWRRQGKFDEAVEELKKAAAFDPRSAFIQGEIGNTLSQLGAYAEAERYLDQSIAMLPNQGLVYTIKADMYLRWHGDIKRTREVLESAPSPFSSQRRLIQLDIFDRNYLAALERLSNIQQRAFVEHHELIPVAQLYGLVYHAMDDTVRSRASFEAARAYLASEIVARPRDDRLHRSLAIVYAYLGRTVEAVREADSALSLMSLSRDAVAGALPLVTQAQVYAIVGMHDSALERLKYLRSLHAPKFITPAILRIDPIYDPLRSDPRFQTLLAEQ
jgi:eukaryotic-like serine/threonine-protein kinase